MKHAIIILVHQLPKQVNLFLEQLLVSTDMDIYIHINKRYDSIREVLLKHERITIPNNNIEITWGGPGILNAVLLMLREVKATGINYGHILINTGQDMLIKKGLDTYLDNNLNKVFLEAHSEDKRRRAFLLYKWPDKYKQLMESKLTPNKILRRMRIELFKRGFPFCKKHVDYDVENVIFYRNWFWGSIPLVVVNYILEFVDKNPIFLNIYEDALVPEEGFMATIIMMSPFKDWLDIKSLGKTRSLTNVLARSNGHPTIVRYEDIEELDKSDYFFARKLDVRVDPKVVDYYYNKICGRL